jgi:DNA polymerase-3 subunit delta
MPSTSPPIVYILHGEDDQAIAAFISQLTAKLGDPATAEMNTSRLESKGLSFATLRSACLTAPFLARRRLVILDGYASFLSSRKGRTAEDDAADPEDDPETRSSKKEQLKEFLAFLAEIPPSTALVLVERRSLNAGHPLLKWADEHPPRSFVRSFAPPKGSALPAWILRRAQSEGGAFTPAAAQLLASVARALRLLRKTVEQGNVGGVFGMVVRQFRHLLLAREALDSGIPARDLAAALELHPFVAQKIAGQARNFDLETLENVYRRLRDIDEEVKSGRTELDTAMESLVAELSM